ncbi:MAG: cyclic nucleotide-binding domain-containing protein [Phaeodactylibacter sp.]|nr:cyclic nucleotide-binding domain-containing protein [Phaeodactylibacter sp.]
MKTLPKTPELLSILQSFETFEGISPQALQWVIDKSDYKRYDTGEFLFQPGQAVDHMQAILQGRYVVLLEQKGETRELGVWEAGYITGVLPFSRMKEARATGKALEPTYTLELHKKYFTEMVNVSYELTQALVAAMSDRVRDFTTMQFQNEKLMALGKLSAGLAHELNNPASAMVRNAEELYKKVHASPEKFKSVITMRITPEQTDRVNAILFSRIEQAKSLGLSLMEREELMDDITDWLEDHGIEEGEDIAETFVDFGVTADDLDNIHDIVGDDPIGPIMWWLESTLSLENLVNEIQEASNRISNLVKSIKDYSHMDRGVAMEPVDVHEGLHSTLTMLKHKIKSKNIELVKNLDPGLPKVNGFAGELNQVWTNLIVNAIDAMGQGGILAVDTYPDREYVRVDITDNGSGIPEDIQTRIFEPFFTTKAMGEGTGMGLDIVKKIVNRHKGRIDVESRPGKTTFSLCFPAYGRE